MSTPIDELPQAVRIREVGPRDGFQNEPETIPTERKVELIDALARTGVKRLEVTSFVRADVIPQLADAAEVLARIDVPEDVAVSVLVPNERGLENALALLEEHARRGRQAGVRRDQRLPVRFGDAQPQERQPLDRGVARRSGGRSGAGARGGAALRGR